MYSWNGISPECFGLALGSILYVLCGEGRHPEYRQTVIRPVIIQLVLNFSTGLAMVGNTVVVSTSRTLREGACRAAARLGTGAGARTFLIQVMCFLASQSL